MPEIVNPTQEEVRFLRENYDKMTVTAMCNELRRGKDVIHRWLREMDSRGEIDLHAQKKVKVAKQDPSKLQWGVGVELQRVW